MSRDAIERKEKLLFLKNRNRKSENQKIAKKKNRTFLEILRLRKTDRDRRCKPFNPRCAESPA
jgi:hypothetical protein